MFLGQNTMTTGKVEEIVDERISTIDTISRDDVMDLIAEAQLEPVVGDVYLKKEDAALTYATIDYVDSRTAVEKHHSLDIGIQPPVFSGNTITYVANESLVNATGFVAFEVADEDDGETQLSIQITKEYASLQDGISCATKFGPAGLQITNATYDNSTLSLTIETNRDIVDSYIVRFNREIVTYIPVTDELTSNYYDKATTDGTFAEKVYVQDAINLLDNKYISKFNIYANVVDVLEQNGIKQQRNGITIDTSDGLSTLGIKTGDTIYEFINREGDLVLRQQDDETIKMLLETDHGNIHVCTPVTLYDSISVEGDSATRNIYTKQEVDSLIAQSSGGGGGSVSELSLNDVHLKLFEEPPDKVAKDYAVLESPKKDVRFEISAKGKAPVVLRSCLNGDDEQESCQIWLGDVSYIQSTPDNVSTRLTLVSNAVSIRPYDRPVEIWNGLNVSCDMSNQYLFTVNSNQTEINNDLTVNGDLTVVDNITASTINDWNIGGSQNQYKYYEKGFIPLVQGDGIMEAGKFIDFHDYQGEPPYQDYTMRMESNREKLLLYSIDQSGKKRNGILSTYGDVTLYEYGDDQNATLRAKISGKAGGASSLPGDLTVNGTITTNGEEVALKDHTHTQLVNGNGKLINGGDTLRFWKSDLPVDGKMYFQIGQGHDIDYGAFWFQYTQPGKLLISAYPPGKSFIEMNATENLTTFFTPVKVTSDLTVNGKINGQTIGGSQTITHHTNIQGEIGTFCETNGGIYDGYENIDITDCICQVTQSTTLNKKIVGIITSETEFASHGDVLMKVVPGTYQLGDILCPDISGLARVATETELQYMMLHAIPRPKITSLSTGISNTVACFIV